ncbi:hypothetical protein [Bacillus wiedmannii]|uniref:hypothetical protein n=1 Tax=Bacillus wiedmannii TaxID=1890302 RepID=UPI000BEE60F3|nr:hypothetical protein [Bacillus wiedmannii]PEF36837.1 hypothetical protein CON72_14155 [Bacillus wiedmannii]
MHESAFYTGESWGFGYEYQILRGNFADWSLKDRRIEIKKLRMKNKPVQEDIGELLNELEI